MQVRQLEYIGALADKGTFSAAAKELGVTQSAVSQGIGRLENEIGVKLVQRTTRSLHLTEAGAAFVPYARSAVLEIERGRRAARAAADPSA